MSAVRQLAVCGLVSLVCGPAFAAELDVRNPMVGLWPKSLSAITVTAAKPVAEEPNDWLVEHPTIVRLLELHNDARARAGRGPLTLNADMCLAAQRHADWMARSGAFAHSSLGYRENIAYSQSSPEQAVQSWTYSPGHYANMLSGSDAGFGYQVRNGRGYWVALFR